ELQAVQQAQGKLIGHQDDSSNHYYCVGYSVLYYKLDGEEIGSLVDQQGDEASIEVIATFLPRVVVESLLAALKRANLEMEAMTLEPIAAINVLIPSSMRRLNVALVDIGAGTSDIAITDKGTIVAYGMVPVAGDEITEALSDHY
ncbi:cell division protein, partial [Butyricicoccus sp. 1XD8-22]